MSFYLWLRIPLYLSLSVCVYLIFIYHFSFHCLTEYCFILSFPLSSELSRFFLNLSLSFSNPNPLIILTHKTCHVVCNLAKWKSITPTFWLIFIFLLSLSFFLSKELFRRKRWRLVSVQLSNKFGYSPWCTVYFVLVLHNHNSLSLGRNDPSFPVSCCTFQSIYLSNALYFSSSTESFSFYSCILSFCCFNINTIYLSINLSIKCFIFFFSYRVFSFYSYILSFSRANINTIYLSINLSIKCSIFFFSYRVFSFYLCRLCLLLLRPRKYQKREQTKKCKKFDRKFFCLSHLRLLCHTRN